MSYPSKQSPSDIVLKNLVRGLWIVGTSFGFKCFVVFLSKIMHEASKNKIEYFRFFVLEVPYGRHISFGHVGVVFCAVFQI